jgi:hypothetical protein
MELPIEAISFIDITIISLQNNYWREICKKPIHSTLKGT